MERIIDGRSTGKTKQLLELAKENDATVVCSNPISMRAKAENYSLIGINFITYTDFFVNESQWTEDDKFYVDELENFVRFISNNSLKGYTLTNED